MLLKQHAHFFAWGAVAVGAAVLLIVLRIEQASSPAPVAFARCLAAANVIMYGADWCPHCQKEKKAFGSAFRYVPYVECTKDPDRCLAADVKGYPTWIFSDGRRLEGEQGLERLAEASGCSLENEPGDEVQ